jgi:hypothetical protein
MRRPPLFTPPDLSSIAQKGVVTMHKTTRLLDPQFKYVPARDTNIAKTFARLRREQTKAQAQTKAAVIPINKERTHA